MISDLNKAMNLLHITKQFHTSRTYKIYRTCLRNVSYYLSCHGTDTVVSCSKRDIHSVPVKLSPNNFIESLKKNVLKPMLEGGKRNQLALDLYRTTDKLNFNEFYEYFNMPDTFNSWFVIVELHVWMLLTQLMDLERASCLLRNDVVKVMWVDVEQRIDNIGKNDPKIIKKQLKELSGRFTIALWAYDEGLLSTDVVLAAALWYKFFDKQCDDPLKLEVLVSYIRSQMHHLSLLDINNLENNVNFDEIWLPLTDHIKKVSSY